MDFLKEDISEYIEGINSLNDLVNRPGSKYLYHRTTADLDNVRDTGMSREFQNLQAFGMAYIHH